MSKRHQLASMLAKTGGMRLLDLFWGAQRLTVLGYHRIADPTAPDFSGYEPNVSATPAMFARQMDFVASRFNVISLDTLRAAVLEGVALPPRPLLITFDDGYLDNYTTAYPILKARDLPAVFFLVSRWLGSAYRPWWDTCADLFRQTTRTQADLPVIGPHDLSTPRARIAAREALMRRLKALPEHDKRREVSALAGALGVTLSEPDTPIFIAAEQARELVAEGIACQMHTASHPILTRISPADAQAELAECQATLEREIGWPMVALAYPNGTVDDYSPAIMDSLRGQGIPLAFTLENGPIRLRNLPRRALEIPRIFLIYKDSFEVFVAKVMGVPALFERPRFQG